MSIQRRFLLALALLLLATVVVMSLVVLNYTAPRISRWEGGQARTEVARVRQALDREAEHLSVYTREWAVWDDTYQFVQEPDDTYIKANLGLASFNAARVELISYLRKDGTLVWAGFRDGDIVDREVGAQLVNEVKPLIIARMQRNGGGVAGVIEASRGQMIIAAHEVRDSAEQMPSVGYVVTGRLMDQAFVDRLRRQTGLDMDFAPRKALARIVGPGATDLRLPADGTPVQRVLSPSRIQLLALFPDFSGNRDLVLSLDLSRAVFQQGRELLRYTLLGTLALFLLTLAVAGLLLRRMVFRPIAELAQHAFELQNSGDYSRRINNPRNDEIGKLAQEFDALLEQIAGQAETLRRLSFEDALTSLRNRRSFDEQLQLAWALLQRTGQPLSLMVLDVDDFKRYNDHYGHPQGDEALRAVAGAMRHVLRRSGDTLARYGGEEFAAILPGTTRADALQLAERVREAVADLRLPHATSRVAEVITVTIGVASTVARQGQTVETVLRMADEALYSAKRGGKNRVHVAPDTGDLFLSDATRTG